MPDIEPDTQLKDQSKESERQPFKEEPERDPRFVMTQEERDEVARVYREIAKPPEGEPIHYRDSK